MASPDIKVVIGKLMSDPQFRQEFQRSPLDTMRAFNLTDKERRALGELDLNKIDSWDFQLSEEINSAEKKIGIYLG